LLASVCIVIISLFCSCSTEETDEFVWHEIGDVGEPPYVNGWYNFGGAFETGAFGEDSLGFVHLKGLVSDSSYQIYQPIFYLPEGYRPERTLLFDAYSPSGDDDSGSVYVYNDGSIALNDAGTTNGSSVSVCLDGIVFFAEQ
jgi:hypothetical protein